MKHHRVIIVGGGPAGAACAWKLIQAGVDCLVLDKKTFPRPKTCAGWITPEVLRDLLVEPHDYPHSLTSFPFLKIFLKGFPVIRPGRQYAIRRVEFDHWLLERSGAQVIPHEVKKITLIDQGYLIDGKYSAEFLVGAGGTHCPVYHTFFSKNNPRTGAQIVALEEEFSADWQDGDCRLWFLDNGLPGYAWYVPKEGGYLNIGVGGNAAALKDRCSSIQDHWEYLVKKLQEKGLVTERNFQPEGYIYYLRGNQAQFKRGNIFLVGDSIGLATLDMGEGIGPAVQSGLNAAGAILGGKEYSNSDINKYSLLPSFLQWAVQ